MRATFLILGTFILTTIRCRAAEPMRVVVPQSKLSIQQVLQVAEKQAQLYAAHYGKNAHARIIGVEWVGPGVFEQEDFTSSRYHFRDHKEELSWIVKYFIYASPDEQKPYAEADIIRILNDGSIGEMMPDPVF